MSFIATAIIGGGALSAGASLFGATEQAGAEQAAAGEIGSTTQQAISQLLGLVGQGQGAISGYTAQGAQSLQSILAPFIGAGQTAGNTLSSLLNPGTAMQTLQSLPGFQFSLNTGLGAINNAATTSGLGGNVLTAANNYAQGTAQNTYGQLTSSLQNLFGTGANAASTAGVGLSSLFGGAGSSIANLLGGAASGVSGLTSTAGQNIAQTMVGQANALAGGATGAAGGISSSITNALLLNKLLGGGALSDIRLKEDIVPVGQLDNELPVYSFRYKDDPTHTTHIGLMAQEVEKVNPKAVSELLGIKFVDYEKAVE
jgi:hypothetical protein